MHAPPYFSTKGTAHIDVAESCVKILHKLLCYDAELLKYKMKETISMNGKIEYGEDIINEVRILGGVEILRSIILNYSSSIKLRTRAQKCLNILMEPRKNIPKHLPTIQPKKEQIKPIVKMIQKLQVSVLDQWKNNVATKKDTHNLKEDEMNLFSGLPKWKKAQKNSTTIMKKNVKETNNPFNDTNWLDIKQKKKTMLLNNKTSEVLKMFEPIENSDDDDNDMDEEDIIIVDSPRLFLTREVSKNGTLNDKKGEHGEQNVVLPKKKELEQIFLLIDVDQNGTISYKELLSGLRNIRVDTFIKNECHPNSQLKLLLKP
jgi:hypothetical protein